jgi:hypothetical protein
MAYKIGDLAAGTPAGTGEFEYAITGSGGSRKVTLANLFAEGNKVPGAIGSTTAATSLIVASASAATYAAANIQFGTSLFRLGEFNNSLHLLWNTIWTGSFDGSGYYLSNASGIRWNSAAVSSSGGADISIYRAGANSLIYGPGTSAASTLTSRTEINKAVTTFTNAVAKATFTVTIPNAAHSAMLKVTLVGSLGAGGAIGANEATASISYDIAICRTAGVNAAAVISTAYGSAASAVAGAATVTTTAAVSAISGAVGASNTFTVDVTITKGGGASDNHTCLCYGRLMNANATGITIA